MLGVPLGIWLRGALAAACVGALMWSYAKGLSDGREEGRLAQLEASVAAYEKRQEIENEVSDLDAYGVCIELGGMPDQCRKLRVAEEAAESE